MICNKCDRDVEPEWEASILEVAASHVRVYVTAHCPSCGWPGLLVGLGNIPLQRPGHGRKPPPPRVPKVAFR
jgi:hypothetical protein